MATQVLSEDSETLKETLEELNINLKASAFKMDVRPLLKVVLEAFFGPSVGLIDMITQHIPSPVENAEEKVSRLIDGRVGAAYGFQIRHTYTGPLNTDLADSMLKCDADGPTMVQITKLYHTSDGQEFRAFGRVMSGTVRRGQSVKVLGEGYSLEDEEDMAMQVVEAVMIDESR
jgi:U5 small nuclear ribonucleoprotein component